MKNRTWSINDIAINEGGVKHEEKDKSKETYLMSLVKCRDGVFLDATDIT